jgi:DNA-binding response OmpR family regulator
MPQIKVLVQEADSYIRDILQFILEEEDYTVLMTAHCDEMIEKIYSFNPEVVLLDYKISGKQSVETCRKIKKVFPGIPVIALSCNPMIPQVYKLAGFDDYIEKPFELDHFIHLMKRHTQSMQASA